MAFNHGKDSYFALGTQGTPSTPTDISQYLDDVGLAAAIETAEVTAFGDDSKAYVVGLQDHTSSASGHFDPTINTHLAALKGFATAVTFHYGPAGSGSGSPRYVGTVFITGYEVQSGVGDKVGFSMEMQVTGDVTLDTF